MAKWIRFSSPNPNDAHTVFVSFFSAVLGDCNLEDEHQPYWRHHGYTKRMESFKCSFSGSLSCKANTKVISSSFGPVQQMRNKSFACREDYAEMIAY